MLVQEDGTGVRLFDRGDFNTHKDELRFTLILAGCCREARLSNILHTKDLERFQALFLSLLSDINQLMGTARLESVDSMFRPATQAQLRDNLTALTRRYVAARWLRHVLTGNCVSVDDMQQIQCDMLDVSKCWLWMSDFIGVL